jgi:cell volume regulation protein A
VFLGTVGLDFGFKSRLFASWAGLRGAVPIVLATYPAAAGLAIGNEVFNLVFFAVILSILVQGSSLGAVARAFKLSVPARPSPLFKLELFTMAHSDYDLMTVDMPDPQGAEGPRIRDLRLPAGAVIILITRGNEVVLPKGEARLLGWDQVTVLAHAPDEEAIRTVLLDSFRAHPEPARNRAWSLDDCSSTDQTYPSAQLLTGRSLNPRCLSIASLVVFVSPFRGRRVKASNPGRP